MEHKMRLFSSTNMKLLIDGDDVSHHLPQSEQTQIYVVTVSYERHTLASCEYMLIGDQHSRERVLKTDGLILKCLLHYAIVQKKSIIEYCIQRYDYVFHASCNWDFIHFLNGMYAIIISSSHNNMQNILYAVYVFCRLGWPFAFFIFLLCRGCRDVR